MVQVSRRYPDGSIKYLRVHDILRDLAIQKAKENRFLVVCSKDADWELPHYTATRRVAIHYSYFNESNNSHFSESMQQHASPNLRSLLIFGDIGLNCSKYRLLRVLANIGNSTVFLRSYTTGSSYLRYLKVNYDDESPYLGEWIKSMKFLETLDLQFVLPADLSPWIWQIETLKHVLLFEYEPETYGPPASANLTNLHTLRGVRCSTTWDTSSLPNIPNVSELGIEVKDPFVYVVVALLGKLKHLDCLYMRGQMQLQKFEGVFPLLENLKHLEILIYFDSTLKLKDHMLPPNLLELNLIGFITFISDPMPVLEKLGSLKSLKICTVQLEDVSPLKMNCSAGGFRQLEKLTLQGMRTEEWNIELGAMPILKSLRVLSCENLFVPQPKWFINHNTLRDLVWERMSKKPEVENANDETLNEIINACPNIRCRTSIRA